jgi:hypothetical protein
MGGRLAGLLAGVSGLETLTATPALHYLLVPGNRCPVINSEVGDPADGHPDPLS